MILYWSKASNPVDWLIRKLTGQDCGHFSIEFESYGKCGVMFQSNLLGTNIIFSTDFFKNHLTMHSYIVKVSKEVENEMWDDWVAKYDGRGYDFSGALYLGLMILRERVLGMPRPTKNAWAKNNSFFCDQIFQLIAKTGKVPDVSDQDNSMMTPHELWRAVRNWSFLK